MVSDEIESKLKAFITAFREAKLVGCVRGSMILGDPLCPLIALCPEAPKKDIPESIENLTGYDAIRDQNDFEFSLKFIEDAWKLLGEATEITEKCPLRAAIGLNSWLRDPKVE